MIDREPTGLEKAIASFQQSIGGGEIKVLPSGINERAGRIPGTYLLRTVASVEDYTKTLGVVRYVEAVFSMSLPGTTDGVSVKRIGSAFGVDTISSLEPGLGGARIQIHEEQAEMPTILLPFNTTFPLERRVISPLGIEISSHDALIDPLIGSVVAAGNIEQSF